jgi:hypothetical protein
MIKILPVDRLIELLALIPPGSFVCPNKVGNLSILSENNKPIGFVDFLLEGSVELYSEEDNSEDI